MDRPLVICRCQEVTAGEIEQAIANGARDVAGVKLRTRAATGLCQGCICQPLIERLLARVLRLGRERIVAHTVRPPARPLELGLLADAGDQGQP